MKKSFTFSIIALVLVLFSCGEKKTSSQASSTEPFIESGAIWLDTDGNQINAHGGGIMYHEGTYYWYGEYKGDSTYWNPKVPNWECYRTEAGGVSCYSSTDLTNWKFEGVVLKPDLENEDSELHPSNVLERPKVIYNDQTKKFVLWLHVDSHNYGKAAAGVAVCDTPNGNFEYLGSMRPNEAMSRDMTLFKDDDGKAYHVYSSEENRTLYISLLTDDYLKPTGTFTRNFVDKSREAPAVFKKDGKYYILSSGCTAWDPNQAEYAVADSMLGEWTVMGDPCSGKDAHITFYGQSTHVLPIAGKDGAYMAMFDKWNKTDLIDSRYIWLPIEFKADNKIDIAWQDKWQVSQVF
ncbi:glycoside hydrolase family 43 protein [Bacteroides propionicifaciens]|uniref:glycoside hydrolase family 43 protein n=1 Tax=Bacteroides propionicifaciens TaxID=392838 RepID=UPI00036BB3B5|nr:glycoside hydrolase family 43 protein [Bacteroides propionicifaciens]